MIFNYNYQIYLLSTFKQKDNQTREIINCLRKILTVAKLYMYYFI